MTRPGLDLATAQIAAIRPVRRIGRVAGLGGGTARVTGLSDRAALGDLVRIGGAIGEVVAIASDHVTVLAGDAGGGLCLGLPVVLDGPGELAPHDGWIGRVMDPLGRPLDGRALLAGTAPRPVDAAPPPPAERRALGLRMDSGLAVFDTLLPIARGQRIGLFAGSGVGKSTLLGRLALGLSADLVVIALVGERGRELRDFTDRVLGPAGMARSIVVAATSDQPPMVRRRCADAAMTVAEHFRDAGRQVLYLCDSVTRMAEAHREVALAAGEEASLGGFPPSVLPRITRLCERAGPGAAGQGDITGVFSVLVAGSDMEAPVADILRGVLDGHVVLDRGIAERGRFPAIDPLRSVSRALPGAATPSENALIATARARLGLYQENRMMVQAGLYTPGSDPALDAAIACWPGLDAFLAEPVPQGAAASFERLARVLAVGETGQGPGMVDTAGAAGPADPGVAPATGPNGNTGAGGRPAEGPRVTGQAPAPGDADAPARR
ncbi:MAG: FliI/YscN family ATPase [Paracoccaceae bacterium]